MNNPNKCVIPKSGTVPGSFPKSIPSPFKVKEDAVITEYEDFFYNHRAKIFWVLVIICVAFIAVMATSDNSSRIKPLYIIAPGENGQ